MRSFSTSTVNCNLGSCLLNASSTIGRPSLGIAKKRSSTYFRITGISKGVAAIARSITESSTMSASIGDNGLPIAVP